MKLIKWDNITTDPIVKKLLIERSGIEEEIKRLDSTALVNFEIELLGL